MIQSPELGELLSALSAFQGAVESVAKDASNPFFKSSYASLPAVVKAASPLLLSNGLCVSQHLGHDEQGDTLTTIVGHKSGQYLGDTMHLRPVKDDPQAQGSATTYGRRYAYMAALGLVADEDDDGNAGSSGGQSQRRRTPVAPKPPKPSNGITAERLGELKELVKSAGREKTEAALVAINAPERTTIAARITALSPDQGDLLATYLAGGSGELLPANPEPLKGEK